MVNRWLRNHWRLAAIVYIALGCADMAYHLAHASVIGDQRITWSDVVVGFEASLFWPVDVAVRLIAGG